MEKYKSTQPQARHAEFNDAMKEVLARFKDRLNGHEMLAVAAHLVGVLVALQDQNKYTPDDVMEMVARNIEAGNAEALQEFLGNPKGNA